MTIKEFKEFMDHNGFEYVGKATYEKSYEKEHDGYKKKTGLRYTIKRPRVIMSYVDSVGHVHKRMVAKLNNIHLKADGSVTGFKSINK